MGIWVVEGGYVGKGGTKGQQTRGLGRSEPRRAPAGQAAEARDLAPLLGRGRHPRGRDHGPRPARPGPRRGLALEAHGGMSAGGRRVRPLGGYRFGSDSYRVSGPVAVWWDQASRGGMPSTTPLDGAPPRGWSCGLLGDGGWDVPEIGPAHHPVGRSGGRPGRRGPIARSGSPAAVPPHDRAGASADRRRGPPPPPR
jgi:hypothetical protein